MHTLSPLSSNRELLNISKVNELEISYDFMYHEQELSS